MFANKPKQKREEKTSQAMLIMLLHHGRQHYIGSHLPACQGLNRTGNVNKPWPPWRALELARTGLIKMSASVDSYCALSKLNLLCSNWSPKLSSSTLGGPERPAGNCASIHTEMTRTTAVQTML